MKKITLLATSLFLTFNVMAQATWNLDKAHSRLGFTITHLMISEVDGSFKNFSATITAAKPDFSDAVFVVSADAASINTDNEKRDEHLRGADYFDAATYPSLTFRSTSIKKMSGANYALTGNLTMHGVTRVVKLTATLVGQGVHPYTRKNVAGFKVTGKVNRLDFGIGKETGTTTLGNEVTLIANGEFSKD